MRPTGEDHNLIFGSAASEEIARHLAEGIASGIFAIGARLPTENELARQFKVSRPVVREAIARVKADGLAVSRRGSGLYVSEMSARQSFKISDSPGTTDSTRLLLELRQPMEVAAARLAAARRKEEDIQILIEKHQQFEQSSNTGDEGVLADANFHLAIARATHNRYFTDLMGYLGNVVQSSIRVARGGKNDESVRPITVMEHGMILDAIREGDPERAAWAMANHIFGAHQRMLLQQE